MLLNWSASGGLNAALSFYAPLTSSLVPLVSGGSGTPTFTRATIRTSPDHLGNVNTLLSSEAAFSGARRVRNPWRQTENIASANYAVTLATKNDTIVVTNERLQQITLTRVSSTNFNAALRTQAAVMAGIAPFVVGQRYLLSYYVKSLNSTDQFVYMSGGPTSSSDFGHGAKLINGSLRRIWQLVQATSTTQIISVQTPTNALGTDTPNADLYWHQSKQTDNSAVDVYMGGLAIEPLNSTTYLDGIALIGDSTMAGGSGGKDFPPPANGTLTVSRWLGAYLNVPVYNRAIGGQRLDQLDAAWAAQITPIALNCHDVIIQGGPNDFGQSRSLAAVQASINSMAAKAAADGLRAIYFTCTPSVGIVNPADEANRVAFNAWLKATFPNVVDIAAAVADPANPSRLNQDPAWVGDGTHYTGPAVKAAGALAAAASFWSFTAPSEYVSADVLSSPFSGANVDGVQCFETVKSNAVDSNGLSTVTGASIASSVLLGYIAEESRTNEALQSRDLSNVAWTKTNATAAKDQTGADGQPSLGCSLLATAANGTATQAITSASSVARRHSVYMKRLVGTGNVDMTLDGGTTWTTVSGSINSATYTRVGIAQTLANPTVGFRIVASGDKIAVDYVQEEVGAFDTSAIPTTTAAITRAADVLSYPSTGNALVTAGTAYAEVTPGVISASPQGMFSVNDGTSANRIDARINGSAKQSGLISSGSVIQTSFTTSAASLVAGVTSKVAEKWSAADCNDALNGVIGTKQTMATPPASVTRILMGALDAGANPINGSVRNFRVLGRVLGDSQFAALTA